MAALAKRRKRRREPDFFRAKFITDNEKAPMHKFTFFIDTYGCKVNQYESEVIREAWEKTGGVALISAAGADYVLINSCAVTAKAERDARNAVYRHGRAVPAAKIILTGCAAQFFPDFVPRAGAFWSKPDAIIPQFQKAVLLSGPALAPRADSSAPLWRISTHERARPTIKIQDGCSQRCAYCVTPQTRGAPVSRSREDVLDECHRLLSAGFCELTLSGINLRQYKSEDNGDFWDLLNFLDKNLSPDHAGRARLRISSLEPAQLSTKATDTLLNAKLVCPHLHLSLQSGSRAVLQRMRRFLYHPEELTASLERLRSRFPLLALGCDVIAGFPGETEADLNATLSSLERLGVTYAHVFPYSNRPGSLASALPGQISKKIKNERANKIRALTGKLKLNFLRRQLALSETFVAVETRDDSLYRGVNEFYSPCYFRSERPPRRGSLVRARPKSLYADGLLVELV